MFGFTNQEVAAPDEELPPEEKEETGFEKPEKKDEDEAITP